jgi:hypothetical protein
MRRRWPRSALRCCGARGACRSACHPGRAQPGSGCISTPDRRLVRVPGEGREPVARERSCGLSGPRPSPGMRGERARPKDGAWIAARPAGSTPERRLVRGPGESREPGMRGERAGPKDGAWIAARPAGSTPDRQLARGPGEGREPVARRGACGSSGPRLSPGMRVERAGPKDGAWIAARPCSLHARSPACPYSRRRPGARDARAALWPVWAPAFAGDASKPLPAVVER